MRGYEDLAVLPQRRHTDVPPPNDFPQTQAALMGLKTVTLDRLEDFYGRPFQGTDIGKRRVAFARFINSR